MNTWNDFTKDDWSGSLMSSKDKFFVSDDTMFSCNFFWFENLSQISFWRDFISLKFNIFYS